VSRRSPFPLVAVACLAECAALYLAVGLDRAMWLPAGLLLHALAVLASRRAAAIRRPDLGPVEGDLVLAAAALIPIFGPAAAWAMPFPVAVDAEGREVDREDVENAHRVFERYAEHVKPDVPDYERTLFTGDYDKDLARELDAESYHEVLRHGNTDQKRNALRRLADLGEPRHFLLVRRCLLDPEHEVRLYAYSELERAGREYEQEIAARSRDLKKRPDDREALMALARAQFAYAESGIHDEEMAAFYFRVAMRYAIDAQRVSPGDPEPVWIEVRALSQIGDFEKAGARLETLTEEQQQRPESCEARADLAFRRRDYATARAEAGRIRAAGGEVPDWLQALESTA